MGFLRQVDNMQLVLDKQYRKKMQNKDKYLKKRATLFARYQAGEFDLESYKERLAKISDKYLKD